MKPQHAPPMPIPNVVDIDNLAMHLGVRIRRVRRRESEPRSRDLATRTAELTRTADSRTGEPGRSGIALSTALTRRETAASRMPTFAQRAS